MQGGDTFRFRANDNHLWIVASDPDKNAEKVLLVNVTTWRRDKEQTCRLGPEHHGQIEHNSCIHYAGSRVYDNRHLEHLLATGKIVPYERLSPAVLKMVREGAVASTQIELAHGQLIIEQGLVDD